MYKFDLYKDGAEEWRWRLLAPNGKVVADGGEGYTERNDCVEGISRVTSALIHQHPMVVECGGKFFTHV